MAKQAHKIGILLSVSGPYALPVQSMMDGIKIALDEINSDPALTITLEPVFGDPGGNDRRYSELLGAMFDSGVKQVVGCYTSSSRKEIIPLVEGGRGLLWYPMHYEGFEIANNVVYTGASPNHHIVPLIAYLLENGSRRAFCIGSNYIWAWENNRILSEAFLQNGGEVVGERLLAVGETGQAIESAIEAIFEQEPDFVFNNLIGDSSYAFFRRFREACLARGINQAARYPVASCTLNEPELRSIGSDACDGHISSSVYFSSLSSVENDNFISRFRQSGIPLTQVCADSETTYVAVKLLAKSLEEARSDDPVRVIEALRNQRLVAPQGTVWVDPQNLHIYSIPRIGRSRKDHTFEILSELGEPQAPDPFLLKTTPRWEVLDRSGRIAS